MKKTIILIMMVFFMSTTICFAEGDINTTPSTKDVNIELLKPTTPIEATFEDMYIDINIDTIRPETPLEATFEDVIPTK